MSLFYWQLDYQLHPRGDVEPGVRPGVYILPVKPNFIKVLQADGQGLNAAVCFDDGRLIPLFPKMVLDCTKANIVYFIANPLYGDQNNAPFGDYAPIHRGRTILQCSDEFPHFHPGAFRSRHCTIPQKFFSTDHVISTIHSNEMWLGWIYPTYPNIRIEMDVRQHPGIDYLVYLRGCDDFEMMVSRKKAIFDPYVVSCERAFYYQMPEAIDGYAPPVRLNCLTWIDKDLEKNYVEFTNLAPQKYLLCAFPIPATWCPYFQGSLTYWED